MRAEVVIERSLSTTDVPGEPPVVTGNNAELICHTMMLTSILAMCTSKAPRETVIPIDPPSTSLSVQHPAAKQAVTAVDSVGQSIAKPFE
ncbi:hypothetical protein NECAME_13375 [Necator americanus]|uniref:Uncharacterized protein n=1 Tax=Necator americanus TaxID=51031 RepID=W2SYC1_NECAM|nr:hypothetical protein NECAME_13375 [Necator americanus]ETN73866.1 hypothetical protein NECAME_13375 [Necator americanus]